MLLVAAYALLLPTASRAQLQEGCGCCPVRWNLRSNLLSDGALLPNLGIEAYFASSRMSVEADWTYMWKRDYGRNRHWRVEGGSVALRRYLGHTPDLSGHHIGVYGQLYTFQIQLNDRHGFMSGTPGQDLTGRPGWGAGVEYGYSLPVARRLNIDFTLGVGYFHATVQQYRPGTPDCSCGCRHCYVYEKTHNVRWAGPTKLEVSLVWRLGRDNFNRR